MGPDLLRKIQLEIVKQETGILNKRQGEGGLTEKQQQKKVLPTQEIKLESGLMLYVRIR